jgi:uncharacterized protein
MTSLVDQITADMKSAMRNKDTVRLTTIRMLRSEFLLISKEQKDAVVSDEQALACVEKLVKQRRESAKQFRAANREDLAEKEDQESQILKAYLPEPLSDDEVSALINQAFDELKPEGMRDMGKLIGHLKGQMAGRADMGQVSKQVKERLQ